jgi:cell wall-associated NlpC family hydrolase
MNIKKSGTLMTLFFLLLASFGLGILFARSQKLALHSEMNISTDQDSTHYFPSKLGNKRFIPVKIQEKYTKKFLAHFFMPWNTTPSPNALNVIKYHLTACIKNFEKKPSWGMNYHKHTQAWLKQISDDIDLNAFPNKESRGITITNTQLRELPTESPAYANYANGGDGYPFDLLQVDSLWAGQPVGIIQITRDGAWLLIRTSSVMGWVSSKDIAFVHPNFIKRYETGQYITITKDNVAIKDNSGFFQFMTRIGSIFPVKHNQMLIPIANEKRQAIISYATSPNNTSSPFPLPATYQNMAQLINHLSGDPYGWGGYQYWRDCSLTMQSIFSDFGIDLPRSSYAQNLFGLRIKLSSLTENQRLAYITKYGIPFSTLIGLQGHVMLYIGSIHGKPYVFHNKWGLHTKNIFGDTGRSIIGKAAITPLQLGSHVPFIQKTLLQSIKSMTFLTRT